MVLVILLLVVMMCSVGLMRSRRARTNMVTLARGVAVMEMTTNQNVSHHLPTWLTLPPLSTSPIFYH